MKLCLRAQGVLIRAGEVRLAETQGSVRTLTGMAGPLETLEIRVIHAPRVKLLRINSLGLS